VKHTSYSVENIILTSKHDIYKLAAKFSTLCLRSARKPKLSECRWACISTWNEGCAVVWSWHATGNFWMYLLAVSCSPEYSMWAYIVIPAIRILQLYPDFLILLDHWDWRHRCGWQKHENAINTSAKLKNVPMKSVANKTKVNRIETPWGNWPDVLLAICVQF
jgi:hypothetical protein